MPKPHNFTIFKCIEKPVVACPPHANYGTNLEAVGVEIMQTDCFSACYLLVRYRSLQPLRVEGDTFFFGIEDLFENLRFYGVSLANWYETESTKTISLRVLMRKYFEDTSKNDASGRILKVYKRDIDFPNKPSNAYF